nr:hypothetical protein [uncultured Flavobacterium sp.]
MKLQYQYMSDSSDSFRNKSLQQYKIDYPDLLDYFKNLNEDNDEINFVNSEIRLVNEYIKPVVESKKTELEQIGVLDFSNEMIKKSLSSYHKIILFLETKKKELEIQTPQTIIEPEPLNLSKTSAVEKIIYLNELGIIDFLRAKPEFMGSTNLMATFLSAITDEKATTLQTSLNRLINNDTDDKNHPYKAIGTVNKIKQTFINKNIKHKTS